MNGSASPNDPCLELTNTQVLSEFVDKNVRVYRDDSHIEGICRSLDGYLNCVLENAVFLEREQIDQKLSTPTGEASAQTCLKLKTAFISGSSVKHISILNQ